MSRSNQIWYSYKGTIFNGPEPAFFNSDDFTWCKLIEDHYEAIKKELLAHLSSGENKMEDYFNKDIVKGKHKWKSDNFLFWNEEKNNTLEKLPVLKSVLQQINGLTSAGISVLEAQTSIHAHVGDTNAVIRGHFPVVVPQGLPDCGLKVNQETRSWTEGKMTLFCDAYLHEAWNKTDQTRVVIIIDVLQDKFLAEKNKICKNVRSLLMLQKLEMKKPFVKKLPGIIKAVIRKYYYLKA